MINSKEVCLKGCLGHDRDDILKAIEFFTENDIEAKKFITQVVPLEEIQDV